MFKYISLPLALVIQRDRQRGERERWEMDSYRQNEAGYGHVSKKQLFFTPSPAEFRKTGLEEDEKKTAK